MAEQDKLSRELYHSQSLLAKRFSDKDNFNTFHLLNNMNSIPNLQAASVRYLLESAKSSVVIDDLSRAMTVTLKDLVSEAQLQRLNPNHLLITCASGSQQEVRSFIKQLENIKNHLGIESPREWRVDAAILLGFANEKGLEAGNELMKLLMSKNIQTEMQTLRVAPDQLIAYASKHQQWESLLTKQNSPRAKDNLQTLMQEARNYEWYQTAIDLSESIIAKPKHRSASPRQWLAGLFGGQKNSKSEVIEPTDSSSAKNSSSKGR